MLAILWLLTGCAKEEEPILPYVYVNYSVNMWNSPELLAGNPLKVRGYGYLGNGLVIFPQSPGIDNYEFVAFDATCTRNIGEETASIVINDDLRTAKCPKCNTVYSLYSGYAVGKDFHLQQYKAYRQGDRVYVAN